MVNNDQIIEGLGKFLLLQQFPINGVEVEARRSTDWLREDQEEERDEARKYEGRRGLTLLLPEGPCEYTTIRP